MSSELNLDRRRFIRIAAMTIASAQFGIAGGAEALGTSPARLPVEGELPALGGAVGWLNSQPLTAASLRGKVALIYFWTYTCINWRRTLPYVRAWAEKYRDKGLTAVGAHTPEFSFEKNSNNVRWAVSDMRMRRVISDIINSARANTDSQRLFFNNCWPRLEWAASITNWSQSTPLVLKLQPIGAILGRRKTTSATSAQKTSRRTEASLGTSLASMRLPQSWGSIIGRCLAI